MVALRELVARPRVQLAIERAQLHEHRIREMEHLIGAHAVVGHAVRKEIGVAE